MSITNQAIIVKITTLDIYSVIIKSSLRYDIIKFRYQGIEKKMVYMDSRWNINKMDGYNGWDKMGQGGG